MKQKELEDHRLELLREKAELTDHLLEVKSKIQSFPYSINPRPEVRELLTERTELVRLIAEVDAELREIKADMQPEQQHQDLPLIVQLVCAILKPGTRYSVAEKAESEA